MYHTLYNAHLVDVPHTPAAPALPTDAPQIQPPDPFVVVYDGFAEVPAVPAAPGFAHAAPPSQPFQPHRSAFNVPAFNAAHPAQCVDPDAFAPALPFLCILPFPERVPLTNILYQSGINIHGEVIVRLL